jgi:hypothetical protein
VTDFADLTDERLEILSELAAGNAEPLARYLEAGGELHADQRSLLVKYLRRELSLKRGNRRTYSDNRRVAEIRHALQSLQRRFAIEFGSRGSYPHARAHV